MEHQHFEPRRAKRPTPLTSSLYIMVVLALLASLFSVAAAAPAGASSLGNYVWADANADGQHTGGEAEFAAGIDGVKVNLYLDANKNGLIDPGEFVASAITGDNPTTGAVEKGWYLFDNITANGNQYIVEIDPVNYAAGGPLDGQVLTSQNTFGLGKDPMVVPLPQVAINFVDADFGFAVTPLRITKALYNTSIYAPAGTPVTFRITVQNTGPQIIDPAPLNDFYSPACLNYESATIPPTSVDEALGKLRWDNLGPLAPGATATVDVTFTTQATNDLIWKDGGWRDYAPNGVPDFDARQNGWDNPTGSGTGWYRSGPVAAANSLWWFDSKFESGTSQPPTISDTYPLVKAYGAPATWDDHDARNVAPLVNDLATRMSATAGAGTTPTNLAAGVTSFISDAGLAAAYTVTTQKAPTFAWVSDEVRRSEDVILLVGFWQLNALMPPTRVGGVYVTASGVDVTANAIAFSDPHRDNAEAGGAGRVLPGAHLLTHPTLGPSGDPTHNDAQYVSADLYPSVATAAVSAGVWGPGAYINADPQTGCSQVAPLAGQNTPDDFGASTYPCEPNGGQLVATVEYAIAVSPVVNTLTCSPTTNIAAVTGATIEGSDQPLGPQESDTQVAQGIDLGDLPDTAFPTLLAGNGARHAITSPLKLGKLVDSELDGQPTSAADGDDMNGLIPDDEDGVTYQPGLGASGFWSEGLVSAGHGGHLQIVITGGSGVPQLFMDFDPNDANPAGAVILRDSAGNPLPTTAWAAGVYEVYFDIPSGTFTSGGGSIQIPFRVRLSSAGGLALNGLALDGEVEDYVLPFGPNAVSLQTFTAESSAATALIYAALALGLLGLVVLARRWQTGRRG